MTDRKPPRITLLVAILEDWPIACVFVVALSTLSFCSILLW